MAGFQGPQVVGAGFAVPRAGDGDLPGYKPRPQLFPPGTPKSPYVKDAQGTIWPYEPWMSDMGDVLEPCWEAPPKGKIVVANTPMDIAAYGQPAAPEKKKRTRKAKTVAPAALPGSEGVDLNLGQAGDDAQRGAAATGA